MIKMTVEEITPKMAAEYLKFNTDNYRKLMRSVVIQYAEAMKAGRWVLNGEAIEFDEDGILVNGQHRLAAIVYSKKTITMPVIRGVAKGIKLYDVGSSRTAQQIAVAEGLDTNSIIISAANIIVHQFSGKRQDKSATIAYVHKNEHELNRAFRATCYGGNDKSRTGPCLAASYLMLRTSGIMYYELELFWRLYNQPYLTMYDGYDPSPVFTASKMMDERSASSSGRQLQKERLEILVRSMSDFHEGKHITENYKISEPFIFEKLMAQVRKIDKLEA